MENNALAECKLELVLFVQLCLPVGSEKEQDSPETGEPTT
jgi:hypothetical protein